MVKNVCYEFIKEIEEILEFNLFFKCIKIDGFEILKEKLNLYFIWN